MYGFSAYDAEDGAFGGDDFDALADEEGGVHASDLCGVEVALVVDVGDHEADLVDVACEHEFEFGVGVEDADGVAVDVGDEFIDVGFDAAAEDLAAGCSKPEGLGVLSRSWRNCWASAFMVCSGWRLCVGRWWPALEGFEELQGLVAPAG